MCKRMKDFIEKIKEKIKSFFDGEELSIFDEYEEYDYADEDYDEDNVSGNIFQNFDEYGEDEVSTFEKYNGEDAEESLEVFEEDVDDNIVDIIDGKIYK